MVEGRGVVYGEASKVTPETIEADMARVLGMDNQREFANALAAFQDFSADGAAGE